MSPFKTPVDASLLAQQNQAAASQTAKAKALQGAHDKESARKVAEDFESMFLAQMLKPMFDSIETDALFGGGPGEDVYRSLLVQEYGKVLAASGGVGIADSVKAEILKLQEVT